MIGSIVRKFSLFLLCLHLVGCEGQRERPRASGEYLYRKSDHFLCLPQAATPTPRGLYPWEEKYSGKFPRITKDFFRCRGNPHNPPARQDRGAKQPYYHPDCRGAESHGLPMRDGKEFVYPCLLDILNFIQEKSEKRVVITCGHRCPTHNTFADQTSYNWGSKHMLGAEVDFYVEGWEEEPEKVIALIEDYYKEETLTRFDPAKLNVSTPAWMSKEVFIKLYLAHEGRDGDNTHSYPYISIQVRRDRDTGKRVTFDQAQAQNYLRH